MKYRALDIDGDYQINQFYINEPAAVGQAVLTRLKLWLAEWYLDVTDGTPYLQDILGYNTLYDLEIQERILGTPGVVEITDYNSVVSANRRLSVIAQLTTIYGITSISF